MAGKTAETIEVIAFEPFPTVRKYLLDNIQMNGLENRVEVMPIALSNKKGTLPLYVPVRADEIIETSCSLEQSFKDGDKIIVNVDVKTLDSLALEQEIAVIKADIGGHEYAFMEGAIITINKNKPIIFIEILYGQNMDYIQKFIDDNDYTDFRLRPDSVIAEDVVSYDEKAWNHAFVPQCKMHVFRECCKTHGLEMLKVFPAEAS